MLSLTRVAVVAAVLITCLSIGCTLLTCVGRDQEPSPEPLLLPQPRQMVKGAGVFTLLPQTPIALAPDTEPEGRFALEQLNDEIERLFGFRLSIDSLSAQPAISFVRLAPDCLIMPAAVPAAERPLFVSQGYRLQIRSDNIECTAATSTGLFYAVQTLKQLLRAHHQALPELVIIDWPGLAYRGWQDDISRGPIPTLDFLKSEIRRLAELKQNVFTLYTEHVFKLDKHPLIAPPDGITAAEIAELVDYARHYHVELIGNFQSFGHFGKILQVPEYSHLGEGESRGVLSPAKPESYAFLADVYSEIAPAYACPLFNINCDETWELGVGASKAMVDSLGLGAVYAFHINRVVELLRPYGKTAMMWGDIAVNNPEITRNLPRDLIVLSWGYDAKPSFKHAIQPFSRLGFDFWVCPGVSCWGRIWPDFGIARINIHNYIRDGYRHGAQGVLNTTWDDSGENLFAYHWVPLAWAAECAWNPPAANAGEEERERRWNGFADACDHWLFAAAGKRVTQKLQKLSELGSFSLTAGLADHVFWRDPRDLVRSAKLGDTIAQAESLRYDCNHLLATLDSLAHGSLLNGADLDFARFAGRRIRFIAQRDRLAAQTALMDANLAIDEARNQADDLRREWLALADTVTVLRQTYIPLWQRENRPWWLEQNLQKYDELIDRLRRFDLDLRCQVGPASPTSGTRLILNPLFPDTPIFYTLDGSEPNTLSMRYTQPVDVNGEVHLRAIGIDTANHRTGREIEQTLFAHLALGRPPVLRNPFAANRSGGGADALVDGFIAYDDLFSPYWQGFESKNLDAVIDLGSLHPVDRVSIRFFQQAIYRVFLPKTVEVALSRDGRRFDPAQTFAVAEPAAELTPFSREFCATFGQRMARYVRVVARPIDACPDWHPNPGAAVWLFADEIVVQ